MLNKKIIGIIPARFSSSRLPGKLLIEIKNKPIIQYVYEKVKQARCLSDCIVATDDKRILKKVKEFKGKVVLTSPKHQSGTDRIAEVSKNIDADIIVNIQGDLPFISPYIIEELVSGFVSKEIKIATLIKKITNKEDFLNPNVVKVVIDCNNFALYFSRAPIPFFRDNKIKLNYVFKHIGIYAYRKDFLIKFSQLPVSSLEKIEKLEQIRVLENGYKIKVIKTQYDFLDINTKEDLEKMKKLIK